jgi:flagellar hook-associated protein 1
VVSISSMYTALSGLHAQRKVLDVTAHNIANESTAGYHRQRVELKPIGVSSVAAVFAGQNSRVGGVDIVGVVRLVDQLAERRYLAETGAQGGTSTMRTTMEAVELAFPEPSDDGLAAILDDFFGGWPRARSSSSGRRRRSTRSIVPTPICARSRTPRRVPSSTWRRT